MQSFEFLIQKRPVSLQTKSRRNLQAWKQYVFNEASKSWAVGTPPLSAGGLRCSIVYLSADMPADIDNIIKPIQDALVGLVIEDDFLITDVDSHRRPLNHPFDPNGMPQLLSHGYFLGAECVYVKISPAKNLREYL